MGEPYVLEIMEAPGMLLSLGSIHSFPSWAHKVWGDHSNLVCLWFPCSGAQLFQVLIWWPVLAFSDPPLPQALNSSLGFLSTARLPQTALLFWGFPFTFLSLFAPWRFSTCPKGRLVVHLSSSALLCPSNRRRPPTSEGSAGVFGPVLGGAQIFSLSPVLRITAPPPRPVDTAITSYLSELFCSLESYSF